MSYRVNSHWILPIQIHNVPTTYDKIWSTSQQRYFHLSLINHCHEFGCPTSNCVEHYYKVMLMSLKSHPGYDILEFTVGALLRFFFV